MLLTAIFWALFLLPGYACLRGRLPGLGFLGRCMAPARRGPLHSIALGYAFSFLLLSPVSLLCYALAAPLGWFSAALAALVLLALAGLRPDSLGALVGSGTGRALRRWLVEALVPLALLVSLLWLQARLGGWLDGDATFHLGRIRVLLDHGFSNRDIYLREYHFQHTYHSNLLFAVYASAAQLTGQSYLTSWFFTEAWAKLLVASGHYVLGQTLTRRRSVGYALAIAICTLNAGETYSLYPNTLCAGYFLPLMLAYGFDSVSAPARLLPRRMTLMAVLAWVTAQVHSLYVIYACMTLAPVALLSGFAAQPWRERLQRLGVLVSLAAAAPFILVSMYAYQDGEAVVSAPDDIEAPAIPAPTAPGVAPAPGAGAPPSQLAPALAAGGGHLEKVLDSAGELQMVFLPSRMGGESFVLGGAAALLLSVLLYRGRRLVLAGVVLGASGLGVTLFTVKGATWAWHVLQTPFVVARLSTVLTSLLVLGVCAGLLWPARLWLRARRVLEPVLYLFVFAVATQLLGHAPKSFREHVNAALEPEAARRALLDRWLERRALLTAEVPPGSTVLTTLRFARYVVMLSDCYVLAADRGHTRVAGMDKRRRDVTFMNSSDAPWDQRRRMIEHYGVKLVTFERRWQRRYQWAYQHGTLLGSRAGQDVIAIESPK